MTSSRPTFSTSMRGYSSNEVDDYLESYVAPLEKELEEARELVARLESEKTEHDRAREANPPDGEGAERLLAEARDAAAAIMAEANAEAARAIDAARERADEIRSEAGDETEEARGASVFRAEAEAALEEAERAAEEAESVKAEAEEARARAEAAQAEAERAKALADAARSGAISGAAELREQAIRDAQRTRAEAKRDAHALVARAREDADAILSRASRESEKTRRKAADQADAIVHNARREALSIIEGIRGETEVLLSHATAREATAAPRPSHPIDTTTDPTGAADRKREGASQKEESADGDPPNFYARRSARLPRIGAGPANDALLAVQAMRLRVDGAPAPDAAEEKVPASQSA